MGRRGRDLRPEQGHSDTRPRPRSEEAGLQERHIFHLITDKLFTRWVFVSIYTLREFTMPLAPYSHTYLIMTDFNIPVICEMMKLYFLDVSVVMS